MEQILAWYNLLFYIPIAVGLIFIVGSAFGIGHEAGHDVGHDVGHEAGGHDGHHDQGHEQGQSLVSRALVALGVGKVPLTIVFMLMALLFGGIGAICNTLLSTFLPPWIYVWISLAAALFGMVFLTGKTARLVGRWMPSTETYAANRNDLVGCTGTLALEATTTWGLAQVRDPGGNLQQVTCRTYEGSLPKGSEVLVVDYHAESDTFLITANPSDKR